MKYLTFAVASSIATLTLASNCPKNAYWEPLWEKCMCNDGYWMDDYGECWQNDKHRVSKTSRKSKTSSKPKT